MKGSKKGMSLLILSSLRKRKRKEKKEKE